MRTKKPTTKHLARARQATEKARARLDLSATSVEDVDVKTVPLSWWRERWDDKAIRRLFMETHLQIRDAFDENRRVPFSFNDLQADLHDKLTGRDVVVKGRRGGLSTYFIGANFSDAIVVSGRNARTVPHDPDTEEKFRADVRAMYEGLPPHIKLQTRRFSEDRILFHDPAKGTVASEFKTSSVQPGHENKGRGLALTNLHLTEPPYWRGNAKKAAVSLIEAAQGGKVSVESTPGGIEWFHSIYTDGKNKRGGWTSHVYEWWWNRNYRLAGARIAYVGKAWLLLKPDESAEDFAFPTDGEGSEKVAAYTKWKTAQLSVDERFVAAKICAHLVRLGYLKKTARWTDAEVAAYLLWRRAKIEEIGQRTFTVEYLENDEDCFEQTGRPVISAQYLKVTCEARTEALEHHSYVIGADTSLGLETGDPAAIAVIDVDSWAQVHLETLKMPPDLLAYRLAELSDLFNGAMIAPERNSMGIATIRKLLELGYEERLYKHLDSRLRRAIDDGKLMADEAFEQAQYGFPTTAESKPVAAMMLEEMLRRGELGLSSQEFCDEARTVVWNNNGSLGALPGYNDDRFIALMIANYVARIGQTIGTGFVGVMPEFGEVR